MSLFDKFMSFIARRHLEKSGQIGEWRKQLEELPRVSWSIEHELFRELWEDIVPSIWNDDARLKRFYIDFQFRIISTFWPSLSAKEANEVVEICANYYAVSGLNIRNQIELFRAEFPHFELESPYLKNVPDFIKLLSDTYTIFEDGRDYTFDDELIFMPEALNYPQDYALKILASLGFTRENVRRLD